VLFLLVLYFVCVFSCTVLLVSISQVIGCQDCLQNDRDCVDVELNFSSVCWQFFID